MIGVQEFRSCRMKPPGDRTRASGRPEGRVSVLALALALTPTLPSDVKRQHVFPTAFVKQILDGFRGEQIPNHGARLSHERT